MTQCPSTAQVMPGGAIIRCELEAGHDVPTFEGVGHDGPIYRDDATPHSFTLTWDNPDGVEIDPDLYDPDEVFDLEVDIDPTVAQHLDPPLDDSIRSMLLVAGASPEAMAKFDELVAQMPAGLCGAENPLNGERCVYLANHNMPGISTPHSWQY